MNIQNDEICTVLAIEEFSLSTCFVQQRSTLTNRVLFQRLSVNVVRGIAGENRLLCERFSFLFD